MCESYFGAVKRTVAGIEVSRSGQFIRSMFRIGCIGFGGGSALIPVIEKEIVERQGIDTKQNIDKDVIVASITPGALPVEIAASIGRRAFGSKGMIAGAVMFALPGTVMTVLLVAVLSMFQEKILSIVNLISVGVSVFIVYLLLCYIRNMLKECKEAGRGRICRAVFLMFLVFAMSFVISSVEILALFFFAIFFTRGNYQKTNLLFLMGITAAYIMCHGKGMLLAGSKWHILIDTGMLLLGSYGMIRNIADTGFHGKKRLESDWKRCWDHGQCLHWCVSIPALLVNRHALVFSGNGLLSSWISFGGGDAYLTIADGIFVEGNMVTSQQYYNHIVPAVNVLPGSILCKTLAAVGYYMGWNLTGNFMVGILFSIAGFACSVAASCSFFMLAYHLYDYLTTLQVFRIIRKWIRPIIGGLLMKIMVLLCWQSAQIIIAFIKH